MTSWLFTCGACGDRFERRTDRPLEASRCPKCSERAELGWAYEFWEPWLQAMFPTDVSERQQAAG